jgi:hypothetical protein
VARTCRYGAFQRPPKTFGTPSLVPAVGHDGLVEMTFWGSLVRFPSHSPLPWSRLTLDEDVMRLVPRLGEVAEFRRADVRVIEVERYRSLVFRSLLWVVTSRRHHHAFVPVRSKRVIQALRASGWPVSVT